MRERDMKHGLASYKMKCRWACIDTNSLHRLKTAKPVAREVIVIGNEIFMKSNREFILNLIETAPFPVFFKDRNGRYLGCNSAFEAYLGIARANFIGRTVYETSPPELADKYHRADQALFNTGGIQIYESSVCNKGGMRRDVVFHKAVFTLSDGNVGGLVGIILDRGAHRTNISDPQADCLPVDEREISFLRLLAPYMYELVPEQPPQLEPNLAKKLTRREEEILRWVCIGKSNGEIASILNISIWTVKIHVANLLKKLDASTRCHAASKAIASGLIDSKPVKNMRVDG